MTNSDSAELPSTIFVISDSTGGTAEAMTRAALAQFEDYLVNISTYTHITDPRRLEALARLAAKQDALMVFTLVNPEIREAIYEAADKHRVECVDLMGPLIGGISKQLGGSQPRGIPGRKTMLSDEYFRRVDAVEFTVKHDDGAEPRYLHKSDIVLVGVSRTSKTPLSTYLAQKGYKVANIPIVLGIDLPPELFEVNQDKIFALTIEPEPLHAIRLARMRNLGLKAHSNYGAIEHIYMELDYANELFRSNPRWPVIDVTRRAVEESATVILETIQSRRQARSKPTTIRG